uniref:Methylmalonic aciduria and homocystinuria type D protein, mitochondrial n=1 Tax=Ciona savignyi TaxID=51511 RepID=H2ZNL8_CIOSA
MIEQKMKKEVVRTGLMAVSAGKTTRLLSYCVSLNKIRVAAVQLRKYSGFENSDESKRLKYFVESQDTTRVWPDELMGPISPQDKRFPLPGNIGVSQSQANQEQPSIALRMPDILEDSTQSDKQLSIVSQLIAESDYLDESSEMSSDGENITDSIIRKYLENATVELAIQPCPKVLYKEFRSIFLEMPKQEISVLTITQKTEHEMSMWSQEVEEEREKLLKNYFGPYTNSTMFETDDRYNSLGFRIDDLGCCKVIAHKRWGSHSFVGSVVTTASIHHDVMTNLLKHLP